jgi:PPOX class probable F420-dependent enzyme
MAQVLNDAARQALNAGHLAHLVTLNPDGSPQVSVVWVGLDGDEIVCAHLRDHKKLRNIRKDARVALSMVTGGRNAAGLDNYLVVTGRAHVVDGGAPEVLQRLARVYLGPDVKFPPMPNPPPGWVTRIVPESVYGVGPWGADA